LYARADVQSLTPGSSVAAHPGRMSMRSPATAMPAVNAEISGHSGAQSVAENPWM
jgi:hypothetical protein